MFYPFLFQIEDKAKASAAWSRISNAAKNLGVSPQEAHCLWSVLAAIYHLGVASVSKGNMVSSYKMDPSYYISDSKVLFFHWCNVVESPEKRFLKLIWVEIVIDVAKNLTGSSLF